MKAVLRSFPAELDGLNVAVNGLQTRVIGAQLLEKVSWNIGLFNITPIDNILGSFITPVLHKNTRNYLKL